MIGSRPSRQCGMCMPRAPRAPRAAACRLRFPYRDSIGLDEESCRATPRDLRGEPPATCAIPPIDRHACRVAVRLQVDRCASRAPKPISRHGPSTGGSRSRRLQSRPGMPRVRIRLPDGAHARRTWRPVRARVRRSGCAAHALPSATIMECMRAGAVRSVEPTGRLDSFNSTHSTPSSAGGARRIAKRTARGQVSNSEEACRSPARC